jgi:ATP-dependent RNA helicase DDX21
VRGSIDLSQLKFRVLDEADEMLRMGFVEDVELILGVCFYLSIYLLPMHGILLTVSKFAAIVCLTIYIFAGKVKNVDQVQTLLFSATLPEWVKNVYFYVIISSLC